MTSWWGGIRPPPVGIRVKASQGPFPSEFCNKDYCSNCHISKIVLTSIAHLICYNWVSLYCLFQPWELRTKTETKTLLKTKENDSQLLLLFPSRRLLGFPRILLVLQRMLPFKPLRLLAFVVALRCVFKPKL